MKKRKCACNYISSLFKYRVSSEGSEEREEEREHEESLCNFLV